MSALEHFKTAVEATWEALAPASDGSSSAYAFVDDFVEERGNGQHRELLWRMARAAALEAEHEEQLTWTIACELYLHRTPPGQPDRTYREFAAAVEAEATALVLAFSRMGSAEFDASVLIPVLDNFQVREREPVRPPGAGGLPRARVAVVTFNFRVLVQETASG